MDEHRPAYSLKAPGASGSGGGLRLPGQGSFPGVDDHLVVPEVTRDEIIAGRRVVASPALQPHARQHHRLDYVLGAHVAPGYEGASDLLTRHDVDSDFASDACVMREGLDPQTGTRHLEEIAFEVVSEQNERQVSEKAARMHRRGVRRIFAIFVKDRRVGEWDPESRRFRLLDPGSRIEDPCLVRSLAVAALLDAAAADRAVIQALVAKGNPEIRKREAAAQAQAVLKVLEARRVTVNSEQRRAILRCRSPKRLDLWLRRAALATCAAEVLEEP